VGSRSSSPFDSKVEALLSFVHGYQVHSSSIWMLWAGIVLLRRTDFLSST